eukprot:TRINITY_DN5028_c0_g1_i1.p1 TRINITY_DN5028_c0_g1~~TRINITY_DN5028_c0_g1_i1.p1  ORF type:complete len:399 (-),score=75.91 TRINITY_DN5028_c0_g1_i1:69-1193(-)
MGLIDTIIADLDVVRKNITSFLFIILNIVSSIAIVISNKWVFQFSGFKFGTFITILHFIMTFIGLAICAYFKMFTIKRVRILDVVPLCSLFCGFVVFTNLSLEYNSVGFYQVMKVLTTPFIVFVQATYYGMHFETPIKLSLIPLCIGVAMASASDVEVNFIGTVYAIIGVVVTSFYQIMIGQFQKNLGVDSMQLLFYQAPISAVMLIPIVPIFDDVAKLRAYVYTVDNVSLILLSSVLAFFVNLSIFLVIGRTSAVSYNVVGHFKLCIVLLSGFLVFGNPVKFWNMLGLGITFISVIIYTHIKLQAQAKPAPAAQPVSQPLIAAQDKEKVEEEDSQQELTPEEEAETRLGKIVVIPSESSSNSPHLSSQNLTSR